MPCLILDAERAIRQLNRAFALWLNLDPRATVGKRLDNIMILRGHGMKEMWARLMEGRLPRGLFNATYVSPGKVRTSRRSRWRSPAARPAAAAALHHVRDHRRPRVAAPAEPDPGWRRFLPCAGRRERRLRSGRADEVSGLPSGGTPASRYARAFARLRAALSSLRLRSAAGPLVRRSTPRLGRVLRACLILLLVRHLPGSPPPSSTSP